MKTKTPLVSVIVPVYNVKDYLKDCLNSIVLQSYSHMEILLIDDGSTDGSGDICDEYAKKDSRIKVFHQKNLGLSAARNVGLNHMNGEYLTFVDSDDTISKFFLELLLKEILMYQVDMVVCDYLRYVHDDEITDQYTDSYQLFFLSGTDVLKSLGKSYHYLFIPSWGKLYHKDIFKHLRFKEGKIHEDAFIFHLLYENVNSICCLNTKLYFYRLSYMSITRIKGIYYDHFDIIDALESRLRFYQQKQWGECVDATINEIIYKLMNGYDDERWDKDFIKEKIKYYKKKYSKKRNLRLCIELFLFSISPNLRKYSILLLKYMKKLIHIFKR